MGIVESSVKTDLVPSPAKFTVLTPEDYETSGKTYPLFFWLHGGAGDQGFLTNFSSIFLDQWAKGEAPEMVVVTPDARRSFYLDYQDGSQKWETFITQELLGFIQQNYRVSKESRKTFIGGISMGGMGSARMAFKSPELFGGLMCMEPGIEPAYDWKSVKGEDKFWRTPKLMGERYGDPIDESFWKDNNPATIVRDNPDMIRESGLSIYIEVGSEDAFGLDRGADFLHRVLFDNKIHHEYRYVLGADHVGRTFGPRIKDGLSFLNRILNPEPPDPQVAGVRKMIEGLKKNSVWKES